MQAKLLTLCMALCAVCLTATSQNVPDYVPTDGLVGWWSFDGTISDSFSSNYSGESYGTEFVEDRFGNVGAALLLDGIDDYVQIEGETTISSFTINVWYKIDDPAFTGYGSLVHVGRDNGFPYCSGFGTGASGNPLELSAHFSCRGFVSPGLPDNSASLNQWTQWVVVYSSSDQSFSFYSNGIHLSTVASPFSESFVSPDSFIYLGCTEPSTIGRFKGNLDDFGLFDRALTEDEILALYNAVPPIQGCNDPAACNFDAEANEDDGSCIPSGCTEPEACNFNALAECEGEACDYSCCPGPGCCLEGTVWDAELGGCIPMGASCPEDLDFDGVVGVNDLMELLSAFGTDCPEPEEPETTEFSCGDPVNYHGYDYATVQIGEQCWFAENLRNEHYANGDAIPGDLSNGEWSTTTDGAMTVYGEGTSTVYNGSDDEVSNLTDYGRLYNWYAVDDARGLCPSGWHVPTDGEFMTLEMELGMSESEANGTGWRGTDQGTQMKSSASDSPAWNGTNTSGFSGLAGGYRHYNGDFSSGGYNGVFWSASADGTYAWYRELHGGNTEVYRHNYYQRSGFSVRCVRD